MLRVLLVEDNRIFRDAFRKGLQDYYPSMLIDEAANGEEALQKITGMSPHLIFMDIRLPGMNGLHLAQKIKGTFPGIHIAILTSYDLPEYRQAAIQYGADHFFVKDALKWPSVDEVVQSILPGIL